MGMANQLTTFAVAPRGEVRGGVTPRLAVVINACTVVCIRLAAVSKREVARRVIITSVASTSWATLQQHLQQGEMVCDYIIGAISVAGK